MTRFAAAMTGSRADGDDVVQAACERALIRALQLRSIDRLDAWMYRIMRNIWVDELRARQTRHGQPPATPSGESRTDSVRAVDTMLTLAAVRRALDDLPEEQRTVLMLVCVDGLAYRDVAVVLGIPIGTVMSRLARGRQELHRKLETGIADQDHGAAAGELPQVRSIKRS